VGDGMLFHDNKYDLDHVTRSIILYLVDATERWRVTILSLDHRLEKVGRWMQRRFNDNRTIAEHEV
jgi:hypothetical protein|tara:strand:- start:347 stop:544 length:198 start_codon:yes stop_codon:yes gene_type:complete